MSKRNRSVFEPNYLTAQQTKYLSEASRNHMLKGSRARFILTCEQNISRRLERFQLNTHKSFILKKISRNIQRSPQIV